MQTKISMACLGWLLALSTIMLGQAPTATLVGQVVDATKANISGAAVTIRNTATNVTRATKTDSSGQYTVSSLAPGNYEVTISMTGFNQLKESNLELTADQTARLDAALQIGTTTEAVNVSADIGLLNTETSSKGDLITPIEISEIPLNGRDFNDLAFTVAGVQPAEQSAKGAPYVANGSRADSSGVFIDGINDESPRDAGSQISPPLDSIQEFKMETSGYTAQYGRLSGSVVNMVTKSGGNRIHGSIFEFLRNDLFDAPPFNFTNISVPKTKLRKNQFGGDLSGPVTIPHIYNGRDRTFFILNLESLRSVTGTSATGLVPTDLERTGDFSQSGPGGTPYYFHNPKVSTKVLCSPPAPPAVPAPAQVAGCLYPAPYDKIPTLDPVGKNLLAYYPHANLTVAPGSPNYFLNTDSVSNWNNGLVKIDHKLGEKDQISGRFLRRWSSSTNPTSGSGLGTFGSTTDSHQTLLGLAETRIFTPNLVNDFRYGRTRTVSDEAANDAGINYALQLGIQGTTTDPAVLAFPSFKPSGFEALGDNASVPITYVVNDYDGSDLVTWSKKRHTFKFGGDILHVQLFQPTNTSKNGGFTYSGKITGVSTTNALADLLAGYPATSVLMTGGATNHILQTNYAGFVQDDYKATQNLTLNLGLRYELQTLPSEQNGQLTNFVPALGKIVYTNASSVPNLPAMLAQSGLTNYYVSASTAGYPAALVNANKARFSPRIGFALRPFQNDHTVIRAGYGIFYTGIRLSVIRTNLAGQYPFSATTTYAAAAPTTTIGGSAFIAPATPFPASGGSLSGILTPNGYDPNAPSANLQSYNLTLEQDLGKGIALEVAYVGSKGTHLAQEFDYNQERTSGVTASRPFPNFSAITIQDFNGISHYDSGQITVRKRFEHGLFFRANYTYAKSLDSQSGANAAGAGGYFGNQNILNPTAEYGRSDFDITHNFTATSVYRTTSRHYALRDWQASGSILAYSGQPFTPKVSGTQDLGQATRPNRLCNGTLSNRTITEWFDPACFAIPASGFGNSGRNILSGPDSVTVNLALGRVFSMGEYGHFEFRWETFGTLNHPSFGYPSSTIGTAATAGVINSTNGGNRIMQFSGRYEF
jgi:Carboxypeptidase regulatory-like domain